MLTVNYTAEYANIMPKRPFSGLFNIYVEKLAGIMNTKYLVMFTKTRDKYYLLSGSLMHFYEHRVQTSQIIWGRCAHFLQSQNSKHGKAAFNLYSPHIWKYGKRTPRTLGSFLFSLFLLFYFTRKSHLDKRNSYNRDIAAHKFTV